MTPRVLTKVLSFGEGPPRSLGYDRLVYGRPSAQLEMSPHTSSTTLQAFEWDMQLNLVDLNMICYFTS